MTKKIIIFLFALIVLINAANAIDSSNWTTANVGYENFKIPPQYANPYKSDFNMYEADEDIDVFTIRYVNPNIMSLYGYYLEKYPEKRLVFPAMMPSISHIMTGMTEQTIPFFGFHPVKSSTTSHGSDTTFQKK